MPSWTDFEPQVDVKWRFEWTSADEGDWSDEQVLEWFEEQTRGFEVPEGCEFD